MNIGLECFQDEQLYSMVKSNKRYGKCDITSVENCIVYDTQVDYYLKEYMEEILDAFNVANQLKVNGSDERVKYIRTFLAEWNIFSVTEEDIQRIMVEICFERFQNEPEIFDEKVTIRELFSSNDMEKLSLLKNFTWEDFCYNIKHVNRFFSYHINMGQFESLLKNMKVDVLRGDLELYRARICDEEHCDIGYLPKNMGAPDVGLTSAGRTNSKGIQCLYLSSDEETTYHEVRARDHDYVSIGLFKQKKNLKIVDLSLFDRIGPFSIPDFEMNWFAINIKLMRKFGNEVAKPMRRFDSELDYIPTQYICDYIKHLGYDGIKFKSTLKGGGTNYAIFNPNNFECISVNVRKIESINYNCTNG